MAAMETIGQASLPFFGEISTRKIKVGKSFTSILFCLDLLKKSEVD